VDTLKQVKKDINEARKGTDCGVSFEKFQDLKAGDVVQTYETIEKPATL
jgi:translation initiation factor IF-2